MSTGNPTLLSILLSLDAPLKDNRVGKYHAQWSVFDEIRGVWIADETLSRVFDRSSQSKQNLWSTRSNKIVKSMLIKTGYPNLLRGCDFLCFNLLNY